MENKKSLITVIILLTFLYAGCGYSEQKEDSSNSVEVADMDDIVSGFTLIETEAGQKIWILEADEAKFKKNEEGINVIEVKDFTVDFFKEDSTVKLTAKKGYYKKKTSEISTEGRVIIQSDEKKVITSDVNWDPQAGYLLTDKKVEVFTEAGTIRGVGMKSTVDLKDIKLTKNIEGEFKN